MPFQIKGSSLKIKGSSVQIKGASLKIKGSSFQIKGASLKIKGSSGGLPLKLREAPWSFP